MTLLLCTLTRAWETSTMCLTIRVLLSRILRLALVKVSGSGVMAVRLPTSNSQRFFLQRGVIIMVILVMVRVLRRGCVLVRVSFISFR